jgi:hypothetical protein
MNLLWHGFLTVPAKSALTAVDRDSGRSFAAIGGLRHSCATSYRALAGLREASLAARTGIIAG